MITNILNRIIERPTVSDSTKEYLDTDTSDDLKSYRAGEEVGFEKGHKLGFMQGISSIGAVIVAGAFKAVFTMLKNKS